MLRSPAELLSLLAVAGALADDVLAIGSEAREAPCAPLHPPGIRYSRFATIPKALDVEEGGLSPPAIQIGLFQDLQERRRQDRASRQLDFPPRPSSRASPYQPDQLERWEVRHAKPGESRMLQDKYGGWSAPSAVQGEASIVGATAEPGGDLGEADDGAGDFTEKSEHPGECVRCGGDGSRGDSSTILEVDRRPGSRSQGSRGTSFQGRFVPSPEAPTKHGDGRVQAAGGAGVTGNPGHESVSKEERGGI